MRAAFDGKHTADLDTVAENPAEVCIDDLWTDGAARSTEDIRTASAMKQRVSLSRASS